MADINLDVLNSTMNAYAKLGEAGLEAKKDIDRQEDASRNYTLLARLTDDVAGQKFRADTWLKRTSNGFAPADAPADGKPTTAVKLIYEHVTEIYCKPRGIIDPGAVKTLKSQVKTVLDAATNNGAFAEQAQGVFKPGGTFDRAKQAAERKPADGEAKAPAVKRKFAAYVALARAARDKEGGGKLSNAEVMDAICTKNDPANAREKAATLLKSLNVLVNGTPAKGSKTAVDAELKEPEWKLAYRALAKAVGMYPPTTSTVAKKVEKMSAAEKAAMRALLAKDEEESDDATEAETETEVEPQPVVELKARRGRRAA
jgi:hypothetical protein